MSEEKEKQTFEIEESTSSPVEIEITKDNVSPQEYELAKKHGLVKNEDQKKEDKKNENVIDTAVKSENNKEEKKEEVADTPTFEEVEAKEALLEKYNKNEKALYWKWKTDKHKRQTIEKEKEELTSQLELDKIKVTSYKQKLETINKLLNEGSDDLTVEQLKKIIDDGRAELDKEPSLDTGENKQNVIMNKVTTKAKFAEKIGESKYDNFQKIASLAKEVLEEDKTGTYKSIIDSSFVEDSIDENMLVERIVNIAKLSPKFSEISKESNSDKKEEANKAAKNATKKISSASLTASSVKRVLTEDELTVHDASRLNTEQWRKLSSKTKQRLLMGINP